MKHDPFTGKPLGPFDWWDDHPGWKALRQLAVAAAVLIVVYFFVLGIDTAFPGLFPASHDMSPADRAYWSEQFSGYGH